MLHKLYVLTQIIGQKKPPTQLDCNYHDGGLFKIWGLCNLWHYIFYTTNQFYLYLFIYPSEISMAVQRVWYLVHICWRLWSLHAFSFPRRLLFPYLGIAVELIFRPFLRWWTCTSSASRLGVRMETVDLLLHTFLGADLKWNYLRHLSFASLNI